MAALDFARDHETGGLADTLQGGKWTWYPCKVHARHIPESPISFNHLS